MRDNVLVLLVCLGGCWGRVEHNQAKSSTRLDLAKDFLRKHQLEAARTETDRSLAYNPQNDEAYNLRGLVAMVQAVDTQRTLEIDNWLTGVDAEATRQELDAQLARAEQDFAQATKVNPDYGEAWSNRGVVRMLAENYDGAASDFSRALENPMHLDSPGLTRAHLGWALFHQKRLPEAAKELRQALQF